MPGLVATAVVCLGLTKSNETKSKHHDTGGGKQTENYGLLSHPQTCPQQHRRATDNRLLPRHAAQMEDVTQGAPSHVASLQWVPAQCVGMWRSGRQGEAEQQEHYEKRWNWRLEGGGEWPLVSHHPCHLGP